MTLPIPTDRFIQAGVQLHIRGWQPEHKTFDQPAFILLHGLASNARTWDLVAAKLAQAGHHAIAVDQRGHGLSEKPESGYDFNSLSTDLEQLLDVLALPSIILAGQSWGGNVLLDFAVRNPGLAGMFFFVDGGYINLTRGGTWEEVSLELRPPHLAGLPRTAIQERIRSNYPHWNNEQVEATLGNFEILPDGRVHPWLSLDRHMAILHALYHQPVEELFPQVQDPVVLCVADDSPQNLPGKNADILIAQETLPHTVTVTFPGAAHDIHVDQPDELAKTFLSHLR